MTAHDLNAQISACAHDIELALDQTLTAPSEPDRLVAAMRHGALDGGKRLRPFLVRASAALFGVPTDQTIIAGAALELVHCYSLVHDDLPDMDNDQLRRGKPTVWKAFDPALGILAGDALLTKAFALLASQKAHADPSIRSELVATLALGAGQMVEGQVLDIEGEKNALDEDQIFKMQALKTGALIRTAAEMGAILGRADIEQRAELIRYGTSAGLAFQIADDILDVTATSEKLGKTAGKDLIQQKSTIVALRGLDAARDILDHAVEGGLDALKCFGTQADTLRALIRHFAHREH